MFTDSQQNTIITRLDELTERVATLEAQINHTKTYLKALSDMNPGIAPPVCTHIIDLSEIRDKFSGLMWTVLEIIGKEGLSRFPDIERRLKEQNASLGNNCIRQAVKNMVKMKVLDEHKLRLSVAGKTYLLSLTDIGSRIFSGKYCVKPTESEMARVKREYHSLEHGYEILALKKVFDDSGRYKEVSIFNRNNKNNAGAGYGYYPDLICIPTDGGYIDYFEYDLGTISPPDLFKKCGKMRNVTECFNFIFPNKDVLVKRVLPKVEELVNLYGHGIFRNTVIRLTTSRRLSNNNAGDNSWWIVFDTKKSLVPVINNL